MKYCLRSGIQGHLFDTALYPKIEKVADDLRSTDFNNLPEVNHDHFIFTGGRRYANNNHPTMALLSAVMNQADDESKAKYMRACGYKK